MGHNVAEFWENLKGGVSGAGPITRFDASKFRTQFACEVKNYEPTEYFDKKEVRKMDLYSQFALICSREAVKDAGLDFSQEDRKRIGVIWGAGIGGLDTFYEECKTFALGDGTPRFNPFFIPKMIANMGGCHDRHRRRPKGSELHDGFSLCIIRTLVSRCIKSDPIRKSRRDTCRWI